ncbi:DUF6671 family protein [Flavobacterium sp.]|uniref:DUF6671 family protein n=1 Tax=Flavobacterium sp. TaxID=239 RepID=UPI0038FC5CF2
MFEGRKIVIATMHGKESVIAPVLQDGIGVHCFVPENFDTDYFGTFSGEIERTSSSIETVRAKCLTAMNCTNCDIGIASEGSFGSHPSIFFANADEEILLFIDKKNDLEITAREISLETNFNGSIIYTFDKLVDFANKINFPSHALILKDTENNFSEIRKGIQSWDALKQYYIELTLKATSIYVETDMRAMYNPTRMKVIKDTAFKLLDKLNSLCPKCSTPGFSATSVVLGLNCSLCGSETKSIKSNLYSCMKCDYVSEIMFPKGKKTEDPMYCDYCNP